MEAIFTLCSLGSWRRAQLAPGVDAREHQDYRDNDQGAGQLDNHGKASGQSEKL